MPSLGPKPIEKNTFPDFMVWGCCRWIRGRSCTGGNGGGGWNVWVAPALSKTRGWCVGWAPLPLTLLQIAYIMQIKTPKDELCKERREQNTTVVWAHSNHSVCSLPLSVVVSSTFHLQLAIFFCSLVVFVPNQHVDFCAGIYRLKGMFPRSLQAPFFSL